MSSVSYLWNSREIEWSCPGGTQPAYLWQEFKPTELDKITGKLTGGPGCMASVTFKGTVAQFGGAVGPQGVTYGCSSNEGKDFVYYTIPAQDKWTYRTLCVFEDMEDKEHTIKIKNSPLIGSHLFVANFAGVTRSGGEGKTVLGMPDMKTIPLPTPDAAYTSSLESQISKAQAALASSRASVSSVSLVAELSKSLLADRTSASAGTSATALANETQATTAQVATTVGAASTATSASVVDSKSFTTTSFVLISATVLAIIVVALIVAMCWNTSPKKKRRDPASEIEDKLGRSTPQRRQRRRQRRQASDDEGSVTSSANSSGSDRTNSSTSGDDSDSASEKQRRRRARTLGRFQRNSYGGPPLMSLQQRWPDDSYSPLASAGDRLMLTRDEGAA